MFTCIFVLYMGYASCHEHTVYMSVCGSHPGGSVLGKWFMSMQSREQQETVG